jgi:hypothetical protein
MESIDNICERVHQQLVVMDRKWRPFGMGEPAVPKLDTVKSVINDMIALIKESTDSISVESGGILVKRTDNYIDVYVHAGGIK